MNLDLDLLQIFTLSMDLFLIFSLDHLIEWCLKARFEVRFQGILQNLANLTIREKIPTKKRPEGLSEIV